MSSSKVKHTIRLSADLSMRMADYARRKRTAQATVVEAALASFLSADGSERLEAAIGRRLDRMQREMARQGWQQGLTHEALALFVHQWLVHNPALPASARAAAFAAANERWDNYVQALARRMETGPRLLDEIGRDIESS